MEQESANIYEPPKAELEATAGVLGELPRFSTWWVLLLTVVTLYF